MRVPLLVVILILVIQNVSTSAVIQIKKIAIQT